MLTRFLIALLLSSIAAFALGWTLRGAEARSTLDPASEPHEELPEAPAPRAIVDREHATSTTFGEEDHTHEIVANHNPYLESSGAYTVGEWPGKENSEVMVSVTSVVTQGSHSEVEIVTSDGFWHEAIRLIFDAKTGRVSATVEEMGDTEPQPPPAWQDVSGHLWISTTTWGEGRAATFEYSLYGLRGGYRKCTHGKIYVDL